MAAYRQIILLMDDLSVMLARVDGHGEFSRLAMISLASKGRSAEPK